MTNRCCCGLFSITTGAQILAALQVITVLGFSITTVQKAPGGGGTTYIGLGFGGVIALIAAILVFVACKKKQPLLMLPVIILAAILLFFVTIAFGYCVYILCDQEAMTEFTHSFNMTGNVKGNSDLSKNENAFYHAIIVTIVIGIWLVSSIWYLSVFRNCYKHLKELRSAS